jgi:predicted nucleotidyltransferase
MRPSEVLPKHRDTIRQLVLQAGMANPRVFGSVLHGEDQEGSDLDLLVDPSPRASLLDMAGLQIELEKALGVKVDVRTPGELHPRFREKFWPRPPRCEQARIPRQGLFDPHA